MSAGEKISRDVVFDILSSKRRRQVLSLLKNEGPMELTDLAEKVAAQENDTTVEDLNKQQRKRVYVSLYQTHVPKLEDADLVTYDQDSGVVELQAQADSIDRYLGDESRFRWQYVYFAVASVGFALVLLSMANVWVFGAVSETLVALFLVVAVAVTATTHFVAWAGERSALRRRFR
ncbi:hypothetical protein BRC64_01725 [Halobacteriales archaeon QH_10_67_22]|nr:MAG: hypothetical protein BRC64_01725 [Halobacteriales archaeon QH_10_67_22]